MIERQRLMLKCKLFMLKILSPKLHIKINITILEVKAPPHSCIELRRGAAIREKVAEPPRMTFFVTNRAGAGIEFSNF